MASQPCFELFYNLRFLESLPNVDRKMKVTENPQFRKESCKRDYETFPTFDFTFYLWTRVLSSTIGTMVQRFC